ncbi:MAG: hypothetical protein ACTHKM_01770 [Tsuneonella sp.]
MRHLAALLALPLVAACAQAVDSGTTPRGPAVRVVGDALTCIPIAQITASHVRDDRTIDFELGPSRVYRNTLPNDCPNLGFEEGFSYATSLSQLCSTDIIHVLDRTGGGTHTGAACGLGRFVPVQYVR